MSERRNELAKKLRAISEEAGKIASAVEVDPNFKATEHIDALTTDLIDLLPESAYVALETPTEEAPSKERD